MRKGGSVKKLILILFVVLTAVSCAPKRQLYNLKPDGSQTDFIVDMHVCNLQAGLDEGGGFIFGPANFVATMAIIRASAERDKRKLFQKCMESLGYTCTDNCYKE